MPIPFVFRHYPHPTTEQLSPGIVTDVLRLIYVEIHFKKWQDDDRYVTADAILKIPLHGVCHVISVKSNNNLAL